MRRWLAAAPVAGILLMACGGPGYGTAGTAPGASLPSAETVTQGTDPPGTGTSGTGTSDAPEALQFSAPVVGGGELDMRDYAGQTVAFWFWAPT